jgi:hypothetical protein
MDICPTSITGMMTNEDIVKRDKTTRSYIQIRAGAKEKINVVYFSVNVPLTYLCNTLEINV